MELLVGVLLVVAVIVGMFAFQRRRVRQALDAWEAFAREHGFAFDRQALRLAGTADGFELVVLTEQRRTQDRSTDLFTLLRCSVASAVGTELSLSRQGLGGALMNAVGAGDERLGVEDSEVFDRAFWTRGLSSQARRALSEPAARWALLDAARAFPGLVIRDGILQLEVDHLVTSAETLEQLLERALAVARSLSRAAAASTG